MRFDPEGFAARPVGRLLTLIAIALPALLLRYVGSPPGVAGATMLLGFLLLAAYVGGELARDLGLPHITGYLVAGVLFGPDVLEILPKQTVTDFELINGLALSVIAMQAGTELRLTMLRKRAKGIGLIASSQAVLIFTGLTGLVLALRGEMPFLQGQPLESALAAGLLLGLACVSTSPATTVAVITETHSRGPVADTALGVAVVKDMLVLMSMAVVIPLAAGIIEPGGGFELGSLREIMVSLAVSLALGTGLGLLISVYLARVGRHRILLVLAMAFVTVELAQVLELDFILMSLAAGFAVQNISRQGPKLELALELSALPIYAVFFSVAGAHLNLRVLPAIWPVVTAILVVRAFMIWASVRLGAGLAREPATVRTNAWFGLLSQAGVSLGIAALIADRFSLWGGELSTVLIAVIGINELVGPPLLRFALVRSGEVRQAVKTPGEAATA